jgi:tetratricopeptide (TPR) repeat protein
MPRAAAVGKGRGAIIATALDEQIQLNYAKWQEQPTNPVHSRAIARLYEQQGNWASAIEWYEEAFRAGSGVDSSIEKTIGDLKLRKSEQELQEFTEARGQVTDPETLAQYDAAIEQKKDEMNQVRVTQAEARVRAHPNDGEFHFQLGEALYKVGQYKRALGELQQGLKQPSVRYQALNLMGLSFMNQGMMDLAVKRFADAESELPVMDEQKKEIAYNLGLAYEAIKQHDKALEQWKKIYEVDMGYRDVSHRVEASYG